MHTLKNSFLALTFLVGISAQADLFQLDRKVAGFVNHSIPESVLLVSPDGRADWMNGLKIEKSASYRVADKECAPLTQQTQIMPNGFGMTLAYPFLAGVDRICIIDEISNSIRLLQNIRAQLPRDAYSIVFAGSDASAFYFLINGRPFPDGVAGYLSLVTVNIETLKVSVRDFVTDVPGLSGAMLFEKGSVWVTAWLEKNEIYNIPAAKIMALIKKGGTAKFADLAMLKFKDIEGMSIFMLGNNETLLYFNQDYDSYSVSKISDSSIGVAPPCLPLAGYKSDWLLLCNGTSVRKW